MRKVFLVLAIMFLMVGVSLATTMDTFVSSNTISFNSVNWQVNRPPQIVTFNSVTRHIRMVNLSPSVDCYCDIKCVDANGIRGYANGTMNILLPAIGKATPNTVEFDFATFNLGFSAVSNSTVSSITDGGNNLRVNYVVTGDLGNL